MTRNHFFAFLCASLLGSVVLRPQVIAQTTPNLTGAWQLNPALTQKPDEVGFNRDWARTEAGGAGREGGSQSGGRGHRGGSSSSGGSATGNYGGSRESADDSTRMQQLTDEVRKPPARLTIVQTDAAVTITDDEGRSRTFHPTGRQEALSIGTVPLTTTARWDAGALVVLYQVEDGRELQYTFAPAADRSRLNIDIKFLERGHGDEVKLTYDSSEAVERSLTAGTAPVAKPSAVPPPDAPPPPGGMVPAVPGEHPAALPPGSELRGLTMIGTVVDELTPQASACGLNRDTIKASISKVLADAGFKSRPLGDEDTFVDIAIVTSRLSDGVCVSRYDASLYTLTDASLSYQKALVSVQVQLLHHGGMTGGSATTHATSVSQALTQYVTDFVSQIRNANK